MQHLWGQILAGEVKDPGSYSLRTLDVLRNINQFDAELFSRVAKLRIYASDSEDLPVPFIPSDPTFRQELEVSFEDILLLQELNLVAYGDLALEFEFKPEEPTILEFGDKALIFESSAIVKIELSIVRFTTPGSQLARLIPADPTDDYILKVGSLLKNNNVSYQIGEPPAAAYDSA